MVLIACGAAAALYVLRHSGPEGQLRIEWAPAISLGPGIGVREGKLASAPTWRVVDLALDPSKVELRVSASPRGASLDQLAVGGTLAAVNGGYFDEKFQPTGWLRDHGVELAPKQQRAQGGVLALTRGKLFIGRASELPFTPEFVLQNSPRLVEAGGAVGIRSDDGRRASRTFACDVAGRLHLVVIAGGRSDGPTLLEAAQLSAAEPAQGGLGCHAALNLDGGPSTGLWLPASAGIAPVLTHAPIAYALTIVPR
jgi:hypothetical protein